MPCARAAVPGLLRGSRAPELLPDAHVILVRDHPDTSAAPDMLQALLYDMHADLREVEKSV